MRQTNKQTNKYKRIHNWRENIVVRTFTIYDYTREKKINSEKQSHNLISNQSWKQFMLRSKLYVINTIIVYKNNNELCPLLDSRSGLYVGFKTSNRNMWVYKMFVSIV